MDIVYLPVLFALVVTITLAVMVYRTNSTRGVNQQFLGLSLVIASWLVCLIGSFVASRFGNTAAAEFCVRQASATGVFIPLAVNTLRLSVFHKTDTFVQILGRCRLWIVVNCSFAIVCQTPFYLKHVVLPVSEVSGPNFVNPVYGWAIYPYSLYFVVVLAYLVRSTFRDLRESEGIERVELQFVLLGCVTGIFVAISLATIIPMISGSSQTIRFASFSVIVQNSIIAYGIATKRIMDVAYLLRRATAYSLVTCYLILIYMGVWIVCAPVFGFLGFPPLLSFIVASLAVAFSMAPAHGLMQRFANRLFINVQAMDVGITIKNANEIFQTIRTMPDLLGQFTNTIAESVGTDRVLILLSENNGYKQKHPDPDAHRDPVNLDNSDIVISELQAAGKTIVLDELNRHRSTPEIQALSARLRELLTEIVVGIYSHRELVGVMLLGPRLSGRIYSGIEQNVLQILCDQLAVALENAHLFTQAQNSSIYNKILLDSLVNGVVAVNNEGSVTVFNGEAQRICGLQNSDVLHNDYNLLPGPLADAITKTLNSQVILRDVEVSIVRHDKDRIPIRLGSSNFHNHSGEKIGALIVFHDISMVKKLETQIRRTDRLASIGTLSASMAHEIKNPLVAIKTFTQLLPERYDDNDFRDTFNTLVVQEVERIDTIVNRLLKFSRPAPPMLKPTRLNSIIEHSISLLSHRIEQSQIKLCWSSRLDNDLINADMNQLQQVFFNFLLNAIEAADPGGDITVSTNVTSAPSLGSSEWGQLQKPEFIKASIKDTGVGIDQEHLTSIFDPFFTTKEDGTGMGLAVAYKIIEDHDATIDVESEPNKYTIFNISFPLVKEEVPV